MRNQEDSTILNKLVSRIEPQANWQDLSPLPSVETAKLHDIIERVRSTIPLDRKVARGKRRSLAGSLLIREHTSWPCNPWPIPLMAA